MEAVGATAAIIQLLGVCAKCGSVAADIIRAYHGAPRELSDLASKIDIIRFRIQQLTDSQGGGVDIEVVFPDLMGDYFIALLESQYLALLDIRRDTLSAPGSVSSTRLRWAAVDRRKAQRVTREIKEINETLDSAISLASFRLLSFQQASFNAMQSAQSALLPELSSLTEPIRTEISQIQALQSTFLPAINTMNEPLRSEISQIQSSIVGLRNEVMIKTRGVQKLRDKRDRPRQRPEHGSCSAQPSAPFMPQRLSELQEFETSTTSTTLLASFAYIPEASSVHEYPAPISGAAVYRTSQRVKLLRFLLNVHLRLIRQHIINFEVAVRLSSQYWYMMPWLECRTTIVNVRSSEAEIFAACRRLNLNRVKTLLECGEANINDVDDRQHGGLLDYAVSGLSSATRLEQRMTLTLVQYLLQHGCNSNALKSSYTNTEGKLRVHFMAPAILEALTWGATDIFRLMLQHKVSFEISGVEISPARYLARCSKDTLYDQINLLRSIGFQDWNSSSGRHHLTFGASTILTVASRLGLIPDVIYAIEVLQMDINDCVILGTPLEHALTEGNIRTAAVFFEYSPTVDFDTAGWASRSKKGEPLQLLLLKDSVGGQRWLPKEPWDIGSWESMWIMSRPLPTWNFGYMVRLIQHTIHHVGNPFILFRTDIFSSQDWYSIPQVRAQELARMWSYSNESWTYESHIMPRVRWTDHSSMDSWRQTFEKHDMTRSPRVSIWYSEDGRIGKSWRAGTNSDIDSYNDSDEDSHTSENGRDDHSSDSAEEDNEFAEFTLSLQSPEIHDLWHSIINDEEGRKHLSRYPLVKALCCALQLVGYRAEMDSDGDIWYDVDDGDPYFDCLEEPPGPSEWEGLGVACEICADPERFGLGYIQEEAEEGRRQAKEERRKLGKERPWDRD